MAGRPRKYASEEERRKEYARRAREKYARNKDEVRDYNTEQRTEAYRGTKAYRLYFSAKTRAKKLGIPFDLTIDFVAKILDEAEVCPLLEVPYDEERYTHSLDKKIPALGYIKENVWVVSRRANSIKNDASIEELELILENMKGKM